MTSPGRTHLEFDITLQPDDATCGPSCLHALYRFYGDEIPLEQLIAEIPQLPEGGTLAVHLAQHAMDRGYDSTIYTCNLQMFDPTWFGPAARPIRERLREQIEAKKDPKLHEAGLAYLNYLERGGELLMEDITPDLIRRILDGGSPIITGLSATWLYQCARERPSDNRPDDVHGVSTGHFVVIHGIDHAQERLKVADPWGESPDPSDHFYEVEINRLIGSIMLGIVTYDAKMLVLRPSDEPES